MTCITDLTYNDILDIVPKLVDYFFALRDAEGETLGINELIHSYSDTHGIEFSGDALSDLAHILRTELDEIEASAKNTMNANAEALGYKLHIDEDYTIVTPADRESYTAEVHKDYKGQWGIQTTSYGPLSPETIDLVIDGLNRAQKLVKLLNAANL